jgi:hypothetical protein
MLVYFISFVVSLIVTVLLYYVSNDPNKSDTSIIILRNLFPGIMMGLLVFVIVKYKDSELLNPEPLMYGNYFD